jgi:hypothetical protein
MFRADELEAIVATDDFREDFARVQESLIAGRLGSGALFDDHVIARLKYFAESVLASAPDWEQGQGTHLCRIAAEISEMLAATEDFAGDVRARLRLRAAIAYELAELPAMATVLAPESPVGETVAEFLEHRGPFRSLQIDTVPPRQLAPSEATDPVRLGLQHDVSALATYLQGGGEHLAPLVSPVLAGC